jgi:hypothetical protein
VKLRFTLEDRIYCLQRTTDLPADLREKVLQADILYLQYKDHEAERIVRSVEMECHSRNITIWIPYHALVGCNPAY